MQKLYNIIVLDRIIPNFQRFDVKHIHNILSIVRNHAFYSIGSGKNISNFKITFSGSVNVLSILIHQTLYDHLHDLGRMCQRCGNTYALPLITHWCHAQLRPGISGCNMALWGCVVVRFSSDFACSPIN